MNFEVYIFEDYSMYLLLIHGWFASQGIEIAWIMSLLYQSFYPSTSHTNASHLSYYSFKLVWSYLVPTQTVLRSRTLLSLMSIICTFLEVQVLQADYLGLCLLSGESLRHSLSFLLLCTIVRVEDSVLSLSMCSEERGDCHFDFHTG